MASSKRFVSSIRILRGVSVQQTMSKRRSSRLQKKPPPRRGQRDRKPKIIHTPPDPSAPQLGGSQRNKKPPDPPPLKKGKKKGKKTPKATKKMVLKPVGVPVLGGTAAATVGTVQQDDAIVVERGSTGALEPAAAKADDTNKDLTGELVLVPPLLPAEVSSCGESEEGSEEDFTSEGEDEGVKQPPPATPAEQQEAIECLVGATFNDNPAGRKFITNLVSENSGQPLNLGNLLTVINLNFMGEDSTVSIQNLALCCWTVLSIVCVAAVNGISTVLRTVNTKKIYSGRTNNSLHIF